MKFNWKKFLTELAQITVTVVVQNLPKLVEKLAKEEDDTTAEPPLIERRTGDRRVNERNWRGE